MPIVHEQLHTHALFQVQQAARPAEASDADLGLESLRRYRRLKESFMRDPGSNQFFRVL